MHRLLKKLFLCLVANLQLVSPAQASFCDRISAQLSGFDIFDGHGRERERFGTEAEQAGVNYLAYKVPISSLPEVLGSIYLAPKPGEGGNAAPLWLEPVGYGKHGSPIGARLGGLNLILSPNDLLPGEKTGSREIQANPNHNAFLLYSPRIFSLTPWRYSVFSARTAAVDITSPGQLCRRYNCAGSGSTDARRREAFESMAEDDGMRWQVIAEGLLPRYEIIGILTEPSNAHYLQSVLKPYGALQHFVGRAVYNEQFPRLSLDAHKYTPQELFEVAADINASVKSTESEHHSNRFVLPVVVAKFSDKFAGQVREIMSSRAAPVLDRLLRPSDPNYRWSGYSGANIQMMEAMEKLLSQGGDLEGKKLQAMIEGAKLSRATRLEVHTLRDWEFIAAEYQGNTGEKRLVLFNVRRGKAGLDKDVPYQVWGIAKYDEDSIGLNWEWTP